MKHQSRLKVASVVAEPEDTEELWVGEEIMENSAMSDDEYSDSE